MAKIIAVCNQKGGVGKTTTAISLASFLALNDKTTLLVDLDPQANATSGVGIDKKALTHSVYNLLIEQADITEIILSTCVDNLTIIPSNLDLTGAEIELVTMVDREYRLKNSLKTISSDYEFIIIDCPPSLGLLTINALVCAGSALMPIQCEYYALEGLSQLMNTINLVKENLNSELEIEGVLLTMADFRTNLTAEVIEEVRSFFKDKVYNTVIPRSIRLSEAPGFGKPISVYNKTSIGAKKYEEFTLEVIKNNIR